MENSIGIQGRPAEEASKYSLLLTDQQGNYTSTELGHVGSCYNSAKLSDWDTSVLAKYSVNARKANDG
jgi:hypothetical protein